MIDLEAMFGKHEDEYLRFDRIENPPNKRPDICGFLKLDELLPQVAQTRDIVSAAEHDQIFLDASPDELAKVATEEDIIYLHRCGIRYDGDYDCFAMFV